MYFSIHVSLDSEARRECPDVWLKVKRVKRQSETDPGSELVGGTWREAGNHNLRTAFEQAGRISCSSYILS